MTVNAYPLTWPTGWKRTPAEHRKRSQFGKGEYQAYAGGGGYTKKRELTIADGIERIIGELRRMGVPNTAVIISTAARLSSYGLPLSKQANPTDPGAAVYWRDGDAERVMAVDIYDRLADNLGAIAATLEAMRAIERHGGAAILNRAFTGFAALPAPMTGQKPWREVLGVAFDEIDRGRIAECYRIRRGETHPDRNGGSHEAFLAVQSAYEQAGRELGFTP